MHGGVHVGRAGESVCRIGDDLGDGKGTCGVEITHGRFIDGLWRPVEEKVHAARGRRVGGGSGGVCVTEGGLHVVSGVVDVDGSGGGGDEGGGRSLVLNRRMIRRVSRRAGEGH